MPSSDIKSRWIVPRGKWTTNLTLTFNKQWLINELNGDNYLCKVLTSQRSFYIFESLNPPIFEQIQILEKYINSDSPTKNLNLYAHSIKLLGLYIDYLNQRSDDGLKITNIHVSDVHAVFRIRRIILENIDNIPSISFLATEAGMCESKLQKCFKQIFGKQIFQYAFHEKMEHARQLLETRQYSVSEVGYKIGYSNLSHFARAFQNQFMLKPEEYLSSLK